MALARALVVEPETLLLDEPLSNLDANLREEMRFEVRRLHDEYRYTTVYVTHDQSEAMTTADVIAVMNAGKIEQAGSPEEIYDRPRSEFVARFIGSSNVIKGKALDDTASRMRRLRAALHRRQVRGRRRGRGRGPPARHRDCGRAQPGNTENVVPGTVVRQVFLGASRDYHGGGRRRHAVARGRLGGREHPAGLAVWLYLPPDRCRAANGWTKRIQAAIARRVKTNRRIGSTGRRRSMKNDSDDFPRRELLQGHNRAGALRALFALADQCVGPRRRRRARSRRS